eukprot:Skav231769  [mRNA]  locus=scaffold739:186093:196299:- [translate_table: standard]
MGTHPLLCQATFAKPLVDDLKIEFAQKAVQLRKPAWLGQFLAAFVAVKYWLGQQTIDLPLLKEFANVLVQGPFELVGAAGLTDVPALIPVDLEERKKMISVGCDQELPRLEAELCALCIYRPTEMCEMPVAEALLQERIAMAAKEMLDVAKSKKFNLPFMHRLAEALEGIRECVVKLQCDSERHYYFLDGVCQKCELLSAWSDGRKDVCHTWPLEQTESLLLFLGPAAVVLTIFIAWEIITAPLTIVEAKSTMADDEKGTRTFTFSVQGPIVHLHKSLSRLVHGRISYRVQGTNLDWLDYNQNSQKVVKVSSLGGRKLILENLAVPFDCGACKGALQATDFSFPFIVLTGLVTVVVMLPIVISIAATSGNELEHIVVTAILVIIPMALVALVLHVPVAWLLRRSYHRTPFREALGHYEKQIQCTPYTGPDADHPYNHGLQAVTLHGFWQHFEGFIWEYNMHFVVSNLVRPLTKSKQVSFVDLWGGRRGDYFVSHSWITGFRHFVRSIHCHALSNDVPDWTDAAYWICSFANNQWNIAAELGTDPMSSAFARVLTNGPKEVAMVLDKETWTMIPNTCL